MTKNKERILSAVMGNPKTRQEVMQEIKSNPATYHVFEGLKKEYQEEFIEFCMGVRGMKMTYDTFFKHIFDAEVHPERLSALLSEIIGRPLKIKQALRNERRKISEKGSLVILDLIVEFMVGELANVEIQKFGYLFPGERASCYSSDMMMRQYEREKSRLGKRFSYIDLKKVYTIVIMEESSKEFKKIPDAYIHRGEWKFDTGLKMNLLQEFYFIPLDIFLAVEDNKNEETIESELEAWLYFIGSDKPEHIYKVLKCYPKFEELYRDVGYFRYHPEEAINMFSETLMMMDKNLEIYMVEEAKKEVEEAKKEAEEAKKEAEEAKREAEEKAQELEEVRSQMSQLGKELEEMRSLLVELKKG